MNQLSPGREAENKLVASAPVHRPYPNCARQEYEALSLIMATQSISISNGPGHAGTLMKILAGGRACEIARVNRINRGEVPYRRAIHVAFQDVVQVRAGGFEAESHLVHYNLRLPLDRHSRDLTSFGIER